VAEVTVEQLIVGSPEVDIVISTLIKTWTLLYTFKSVDLLNSDF